MTGVLRSEGKTLEVTECCVCAVDFAVPSSIMDNRRKNAGSIYCPNGHSIGWGESDADRLRKKLKAEQENVDFWRKRAASADAIAETAKRSRAAVVGQLTKERKRVGNGVCPCCNRTFANVTRHMSTQHPDFKKAEVDG